MALKGVRVKTKFEAQRVKARTREGNFKSLGHAGGAIRLTAKRSIRKRKKASDPGQPPHTRDGRLRNAIAYAVEKDKQRVVIGPQYDKIGTAGRPHEFGGRYKREKYPKRPFMRPALDKLKDRLPPLWANSIQ